jgi:hypothetical protein
MECTSNGRTKGQTWKSKHLIHGRVRLSSAIPFTLQLLFISLVGKSRNVDNSWYFSDGESANHLVPAKRKFEHSEDGTNMAQPLHSGTLNSSLAIEPTAKESRRNRKMEAKRQRLTKHEQRNKSSVAESKLVSSQNGKPSDSKDTPQLRSQPQQTESIPELQAGLRIGSVSRE